MSQPMTGPATDFLAGGAAGAGVGVAVIRRCTVAGMYAMLIDGRLANMHISAEHVALTAMVYVTVGSSAEMFFCTPSVTE